MTKDKDIRAALKKWLRDQGKAMIVIDEVGIHEGGQRVDVLTVSDHLAGYEIKSDCDTLNRLAKQRDSYNQCFDQICLVLGETHVAKALPIVPEWWGIMVAKPLDDGVKIIEEREPQNNPMVDPSALVRMIWRPEALELLRKKGIRGMSSKKRNLIWGRLIEECECDEIRKMVREAITTREVWKSRYEVIEG